MEIIQRWGLRCCLHHADAFARAFEFKLFPFKEGRGGERLAVDKKQKLPHHKIQTVITDELMLRTNISFNSMFPFPYKGVHMENKVEGKLSHPRSLLTS